MGNVHHRAGWRDYVRLELEGSQLPDNKPLCAPAQATDLERLARIK
jgi:hypothetical protein